MKLNFKFKNQFIANVLAATETSDKHKILCAKWLQGFEKYVKAVVRKDYVKKYRNVYGASIFDSPRAKEIFPSIPTLYIDKTLNPHFSDSNYECQSVLFSSPITVPAYMLKDTEGSTLVANLVLPYTKQKSVIALVVEAKVLAEAIWERKKELIHAIDTASNMKQFCKNYPELVKHFPLTGEDSESLNLIANLRKMGFDTTEKKRK